MLFTFLLVTMLIASESAPHTITLDLPVDCSNIGGCFMQNYVDIDPSDAYQDFTCGSLSYDGHKGTDFRLNYHQQIHQNIPVLAAADGTVVGARNHVPDHTVTDDTREQIKNIECGNGVRLAHPGGWATQYCHLKQDSVAVTAGEHVTRGQRLGYIGLSGLTEFPHLHLQVSYTNQIVDPYTARFQPTMSQDSHPLDSPSCDPRLDQSLWSPKAREELGYIPTAVLGGGFVNYIPDLKKVRDEQPHLQTIKDNSKLLIFWAEVAGIRAGDQTIAMVIGPDGNIIASNEETFTGSKAAIFRYIGARKPEGGWKAGTYKANLRVLRGGETASIIRRTVEIVAAH